MQQALKEALKSLASADVPVGAIIVKDNKIVARSHNERTKDQTTTSHAEIKAIEKANKKLGSWLLEECTLYSTLEPCPMCAGTILQARMKRVVFAAKEPKFGSAGSIINLLENPAFNHQVMVTSGILQDEAAQLLKDFFQNLRKNK